MALVVEDQAEGRQSMGSQDMEEEEGRAELVACRRWEARRHGYGKSSESAGQTWVEARLGGQRKGSCCRTLVQQDLSRKGSR